MRSRKGRWNTGLLERHLRIVLAGLIGVERLRSGTTSGADSAGLRIWTCFPLKKKERKKKLKRGRVTSYFLSASNITSSYICTLSNIYWTAFLPLSPNNSETKNNGGVGGRVVWRTCGVSLALTSKQKDCACMWFQMIDTAQLKKKKKSHLVRSRRGKKRNSRRITEQQE